VASLHDIAPRLAAARDQLLADRAHARARHHWLVHRVSHLEALVAHRDLQLIRAMHTRDGRYIARRQTKLKHAQEELERRRRHLSEIPDEVLVLVPAELERRRAA
jgi:hypothetical protein